LARLTSSLSRAKSVTDVATAGAEQISDVIIQMQAKAVEASDDSLTTESRAAINKDFMALRDQVTSIVNSSSFNGTNLLKTGGGTVTALQSLNDSDSTTAGYQTDSLNVDNQTMDLAAAGTAGALSVDSQIATAADAKSMVDTLKTLAQTTNTKLSTLGAASRKIDTQSTFISKLSDSIEAGIGNLVDADLAKESAKLQALQVKQQLGVQALSIANQAPQTITSLFR